MIITGAPIEQMPFEEVSYWDELKEIMEWTKTNVTSTFHICWGAQAGLYYHYGIDKYALDDKMFGIFKHKVVKDYSPLLRGFNDEFLVPHSRHTSIHKEPIMANDQLELLAESDEAGIYIVKSVDNKQIFVTGHSEYEAGTLELEYLRDKGKGLDIQIPYNYFPNDDDTQKPVNTWRSHAHLLYANWLNYYVYQLTPFKLDEGEE
jgi:homoserine O-succinyltransferase